MVFAFSAVTPSISSLDWLFSPRWEAVLLLFMHKLVRRSLNGLY
jgi:hypothetical protein